MQSETQLIGQIKDAYGRESVMPTYDFTKHTEEFKEQKAEKKKEIASMVDIGASLDAARYTQIEGGLNDLMDKAKDGSLVVGSPQWVAEVGKWKASAAQLSEAAKIDKELTEQAFENPDTFSYYKTNENGVLVEAGLQGYKDDMMALNEQEFDSPQDRVAAEMKLSQRVNLAKRSTQDAYRELLKESTSLNKELNKSADKVSERVSVTLGNETFEITSQLDPDHTQQVVDMFTNQFAEDLGREYAQLANQGRIPKNADGTEMKPMEYVQSQVKAFITKGDRKTELRRYTPHKTDSDNGFKSNSNGWSFGNYYGSIVTEKIEDPFGGEESDVVSEITIENKKTNPSQDFVDERDRAIRGSLVRIKRNLAEGGYMLVIRSGGKSKEIPLDKNFDVLRTEYGLSEEEVEELFSRNQSAPQKGDRVIGTTPNNGGSTSKYNSK